MTQKEFYENFRNPHYEPPRAPKENHYWVWRGEWQNGNAKFYWEEAPFAEEFECCTEEELRDGK